MMTFTVSSGVSSSRHVAAEADAAAVLSHSGIPTSRVRRRIPAFAAVSPNRHSGAYTVVTGGSAMTKVRLIGAKAVAGGSAACARESPMKRVSAEGTPLTQLSICWSTK